MSIKQRAEVKGVFKKKSREELEELVLAYGRAHARICELSSLASPEHQPLGEHEKEKHGHVSEDEMRKRIKTKSNEELIDLLADAALVEVQIVSSAA